MTESTTKDVKKEVAKAAKPAQKKPPVRKEAVAPIAQAAKPEIKVESPPVRKEAKPEKVKLADSATPKEVIDLKARKTANEAASLARRTIKRLEDVFGLDIDGDGKIGKAGRTYLPLLLSVLMIGGWALAERQWGLQRSEDDSLYSIQVDGDGTMQMTADEATDCEFIMEADQGDDDADTWKVYVDADDSSTIKFASYQSGAYVDTLELTTAGAMTVTSLAMQSYEVVVDASASRTCTSADYGKVISYTQAGAFLVTLPANGAPAGAWIDFIQGTIQNDTTALTVQSTPADTMITANSIDSDSVTFGTGHRVGSYLRMISDGAYWQAVNLGQTTMSVTDTD